MIYPSPEGIKIPNDNWRTPKWLYRYLESVYGPFDIDLAASDRNAKCKTYYTINDNALTKQWSYAGRNGFCNPPYSQLSPWLVKAKYEQSLHFQSTWVLPCWNGERFWLLTVFGAQVEITRIFGRVTFLDYFNEPVKGNRGGTMIVHYPRLPSLTTFPVIRNVERDELIKKFSKGVNQ